MGLLKRGLPCPSCGGSDPMAIYENEETGEQWENCFSCDHRKPIGEHMETQPQQQDYRSDWREQQFDRLLGIWRKNNSGAIPKRCLSSSTVRKYGVVLDGDEQAYPYFAEDGLEPVAFKMRKPNKDFPIFGNITEAQLFGQQLYGNHKQRRVVLVEGELDALAVHQMFSGKVPVVSVKLGSKSAGKDVKQAFKFLDGFEEIVCCFDADEPGKEATQRVADVFAGKLRIMQLDPRDGKDACDYLMAGKEKEFESLYWGASQFVPDGVLSVEDMRSLLSAPEPDKLAVYPWPELNKLTEGMRPTELVTLCAGSGLGKSSVLREVVMHIRNTTDVKVGCLFMEESPKKTIEGFMSIDLSTPLHLDRRGVERNSDEYWNSFERVFGDGQLFVMDASFDTGATVDEVVGRVRFMAKALDCKVIILDHISILVSAGQHGDERKALDEIMTKLRSLTQDTGIVLLAVSHLKRPDGKGHEEGAATSVSQLRGSASIAQLSDCVIGLERNGQADDPEERNTTHLRVLKNRHSGITGPAGALLYDTETGRLSAHVPPEEEAL